MQRVLINPNIIKNQRFLYELAKTKTGDKRYRLLQNATTEQLLAIAEICLNIVSSRFSLTPDQKKRLLPYADIIRQISRLKTEQDAKRVIIQKGSGMPGLFSALLSPILIELVRSYSES